MINLLPYSYRRRQMARKRAIQWCVVICIVFVGSWASHWYELREQTALAQRLEVLSREHEPTQTMLQQLVKMRQRLNNLQAGETVAREVEYQRNPLALLGVISQTARQTNGHLRVTKLQLSDFQKQVDAALLGVDSSLLPSVLVTGVSLDNPAVAELLSGLQDSGLFSEVELLALREREDGDGRLRDYEVRCEF
jgi:Tfp pilus assembly protein PilN